MLVTIVYESMYGNTHAVADQIAAGFDASADVGVSSVGGADLSAAAPDLLIVGGPTHAHGMTSSGTREAAAEAADKDEDLDLDEHAGDKGLRDWLGELSDTDGGLAVAFDTRIDAAPLLTGRASKGIAKRLRHHGYELIAEPESFLVDKENHLLPGEADRARAWGAQLAALLAGTHSG